MIIDNFWKKAILSPFRLNSTLLQLLAVLLCIIHISAIHPFFDRRHWGRKENPFRLNIVMTMTPGWEDELKYTLVKWAQTYDNIFEFNLSNSTYNTPAERASCNPIRGKVRICDSDDYQTNMNNWVARTSLRVTKDNLTVSAVIRIDTSTNYWEGKFKRFARSKVMCHEIGHVLGVDHPFSTVDGSSYRTCMDYSNTIGSLAPNQEDMDTLHDLYGAYDSKNTYKKKGELGVIVTKSGVSEPQERENEQSIIFNETFASENTINNIKKSDDLVASNLDLFPRTSVEMDCSVVSLTASMNDTNPIVVTEENEFSVSYVEECGDEKIYHEILKARQHLFKPKLKDKIYGKKGATANLESTVEHKTYFDESKHIRGHR